MNGFSQQVPASSDAAQAGFGGEESTTFASQPAASGPSDPALLSMNTLSGQDQPLVSDDMKGSNGTTGKSMADQAYAKLVNMDAFDLVQDKNAQRNNPFETASTTSSKIGGGNPTASLSDIMKSKNKTGEKKEIMKSHAPPAGAMVLSGNQQGNFGGYGSQYGMGGMGTGQQQPLGGMMGQPPAPQMQGYGGMQQQPPYGQPPAMQQPYVQQGYGMQQPPPMQQQQFGIQQQQQPQYGQPPPMQQQFGQPPPMQQQPFGF
jgi:hypothetical protein